MIIIGLGYWRSRIYDFFYMNPGYMYICTFQISSRILLRSGNFVTSYFYNKQYCDVILHTLTQENAELPSFLKVTSTIWTNNNHKFLQKQIITNNNDNSCQVYIDSVNSANSSRCTRAACFFGCCEFYSKPTQRDGVTIFFEPDQSASPCLNWEIIRIQKRIPDVFTLRESCLPNFFSTRKSRPPPLPQCINQPGEVYIDIKSDKIRTRHRGVVLDTEESNATITGTIFHKLYCGLFLLPNDLWFMFGKRFLTSGILINS